MMKKLHLCALAAGLTIAIMACGKSSDCGVGEEGCKCTPGGSCNAGLSCASGLCVDPNKMGGAGGGGGMGPVITTLSADQLCGSLCMQTNMCDRTRDVQICKASCVNDLTLFASKYRPDILMDADACLKRKDCATILKGAGKAFEQCVSEAKATRAPSAVGIDMCNRWEAAATKCGMVFNKATCLDVYKVYRDEVLQEGIKCADKACTDIGPCMKAVFGI